MGQAKQRGTKEQRVAEAIERNERAAYARREIAMRRESQKIKSKKLMIVTALMMGFSASLKG